ncbi:MAG: pilus assembly protein PilP [Pseudomonadota bacterium]
MDIWYEDVESNQLEAGVSLEQPNAFNEKPLTELAREGNTHIYRFSCFPSHGPDVSIRLQINAAGSGIIFLKQLDSRDSQVIRSQPQYTVEHSDISRFLALLKSMDFWNMQIGDLLHPNLDGSTWVLEGIKKGVFHAITRWSPEPGEFRDAMLLLLSYAGLDTCETFGLLGQYELHKLEYLGFLSSGDPPLNFGIVKTPDGLLERVRSGDGMGAHYGMVKKVTEGYIEIVEFVLNGRGERKERRSRLNRSDSYERRNSSVK